MLFLVPQIYSSHHNALYGATYLPQPVVTIIVFMVPKIYSSHNSATDLQQSP